MKKCKVIDCKNSCVDDWFKKRNELMEGRYGYCQIHYIEGLVKEARE